MSDSEEESSTKGQPPLFAKDAPHSPSSMYGPASPPNEGSEQPTKPKLSLYQRIQIAKAAVRAREEIELAAANPLPDSDDEDQDESDHEELNSEESNPSDQEVDPAVHSSDESDDNNWQEVDTERGGSEGSEQKRAAVASCSDSEQSDRDDISALRSPVESDDNDQDNSEQETLEYDSNRYEDDNSSEEEEKSTSKKVRSLTEMAEKRVLEQLKKAVTGYQATANYCAGGSIPISAAASQPVAERPGTSKAPITSPPTVLRWDVPGKAAFSQRIQFPFSSGSDAKSLSDLLATCAPATFGLGGEDVLDERYRKAGKLDRSQFSTDFHPHDYGIVDAISQILLPDFRSPGMKGRGEHRGVLAELYKLNIYSSPAGKFQAHVDTPRGLTQFGSLVVCLPHPHEGGQLRVSHKGHSTFFDWSNTESDSLQWAAFYSDCEHEVLEVKTGHRITITYNLYVTEHIGGVIQRFPTVDAALSPLYEGAKQMLEQPGFMKDGGTLGFYCAHQYAHARNDSTGKLMPYALKGIDVALFSVFKSLGLKVSARPLLDPREIEEYDENLYERYEESFYEWNPHTRRRVHKDEEKFKNRLSREEFEKKRGVRSRAGKDFHSLKLSDVGANDEGWDEIMEDIRRMWPMTEYKDVLWLNKATRPGGKGWEVALVNLRYGNNASLGWHYSHAVIFIKVPSRAERGVVGSSD